MDVRKNKIANKILKTIYEADHKGLIFSLANSSNLAKWYISHDRQQKYRIRKTFDALRRNDLISFIKDNDGQTRLLLTESGKKAVEHQKLNELSILPMKKWDKKWRLVLFSIPNNLKSKRNYLRSTLKRMRFSLIQDGAWIHPFDCKLEIELIAETLEIKNYLTFALTTTIDNEEILKKRFEYLLGR